MVARARDGARICGGLLAALAAACGSNPDVLYVGTAPSPFDAVCTPMVELDNLDPSGGGKVFTDLVEDHVTYVQGLTRQICPVLYRTPDEVPAVPKITLVLRPINTPVTGITGNLTTVLSSSFLQTYATSHSGDETRYEVTGLLAFHFSHNYQRSSGAPQGVVEGVNDYVRYRLGYRSLDHRRAGGVWDAGDDTTGFFFEYLDRQFPGFVYRLNLAIGNGYDPRLFETLTGKDVATLWNEYQASF